MTHSKKSLIVATGFAMFTMFFGAGNIVFPLALGQIAQDKNFFAIIGLLITAVGVPFAGLIAMSLFDGDYKLFFSRLGKTPGFLVAAVIMGLIGPFGAMPRCIALSYSTAVKFLPGISLPIFSLICCLIMFAFTYRPTKILDVLGFVMTPILITSLGIIIFFGLIYAPDQAISDHESWPIFFKGLNDGYQTMDLLGGFFFSSVIVIGLKNDLPKGKSTHKNLLVIALKSSVIGASLLGLSYIGFSYVTAFHSLNLNHISSDQLISELAIQILGPYASVVAIVAVAFSCLTTALTLAAVFAEFIHKDVSFGKIGYIPALIATYIVTFFISTLNFEGIAAFLFPILQICYPSLILLTFLNIAYKIYGFKPVKIPFLLMFIASLAIHFFV